jgi:hypothetical protein
MTTKRDIFEEHLHAWLRARKDKKKRGEIIRHICFVAGMHKKSIPRSFTRLQMRDGSAKELRGRKAYYTPDVTAALRQIFDTASEPCAENLFAIVPEYVAILEREKRWRHSTEATEKLLHMSLGTMKTRIAGFSRKTFITHGKSTTKKGAIHVTIPIRTGPWNEAPCGTEQIDTVAHCGESTAGDFIYTVNSTDVATLWGTRRAQWNKGQTATVESIERIDTDIPFTVIEWHPDSGAEFINWHCKGFCEKRVQLLTRSRPNHKNDNCFVEERNGHIVRRWVGYARFDARQVVDALNDVYDVLTPYCNHFMASRRIVSKLRIGARWKVTRERVAKTPYQRVLERNDVPEEVKTKLKQEHETLSPLALKEEIDRRLKRVFTLQKQRGNRLKGQRLR